MRTMPNTAFWQRLQADKIDMVELIDFELRNVSYHWTTGNHRIMYTLSGALTPYDPFPGNSDSGLEESSDLGVSVVGFKFVNSGDIIRAVLQSDDLSMAEIKVGRVFIDTPDLGRYEVYHGKLGDISYNRNIVSGQARNRWNSLSGRWPYHTYNDRCAWRFGSDGCGFNTSSITLTFPTTSMSVNSCTTLVIAVGSGSISSSYSNGRFDFGRLTVTGGVNSGHIRTVRAHSGDFLALSHPLPINSFGGISITLYPGCRKRLIDDCKSLYNNDENFLGFPWIPIQEEAF